MAPFRFLDLAAELRNRIYEHALFHNRDDGYTANVALLRVSKQVYSEAKGILHELDTFTIHATPNVTYDYESRNPAVETSMALRGDIAIMISEEESSVLEIYTLLPSIMLKARKIHLHLRIQEWGSGEDVGEVLWAEGAVRLLYALTSFINSDGDPRSLHVICNDESSEDANSVYHTLHDILIQLWNLRPHVSLECFGFDERLLRLLKLEAGQRMERGMGLVNPVETYLRCGPILNSPDTVWNGSLFLAAAAVEQFRGLELFLKDRYADTCSPRPFYEKQPTMEVMAVGVQTAAFLLDRKDTDRIKHAQQCLRVAALIRTPYTGSDFNDPSGRGEERLEELKDHFLEDIVVDST